MHRRSGASSSDTSLAMSKPEKLFQILYCTLDCGISLPDQGIDKPVSARICPLSVILAAIVYKRRDRPEIINIGTGIKWKAPQIKSALSI